MSDQAANNTICISVGENNECFIQWRQWFSGMRLDQLGQLEDAEFGNGFLQINWALIRAN